MKKALVPVLLLLLIAAIGYIVYMKMCCSSSKAICYACGDSTHISFRGYKILYGNDTSQFVMLKKLPKDSKTAARPITPKPGSTIERELGVNMIRSYQEPLDHVHDSATMRYVQFGIANVIEYTGYLLAIADGEIAPEDMDIRIFLAQSNKHETMPNGTDILQNTVVVAPRIPPSKRGPAAQKFLDKIREWLYFDQGSICPKCDDFSGLNESK